MGGEGLIPFGQENGGRVFHRVCELAKLKFRLVSGCRLGLSTYLEQCRSDRLHAFVQLLYLFLCQPLSEVLPGIEWLVIWIIVVLFCLA